METRNEHGHASSSAGGGSKTSTPALLSGLQLGDIDLRFEKKGSQGRMDTQRSYNNQSVINMDEACIRRQQRADELLAIEDNLPTYDEAADDSVILVGFADVWSEIRKDCFKWLQKASEKIPLPDKLRMSRKVCSQIDTDTLPRPTWQVIHGSLLCLLGLLPSLQSTLLDGLREELKIDSLLMSFIGHVQLTVREVATQCLFSFHCLGSATFVDKVLSRLDHLVGQLYANIHQQHAIEHEVGGLLSVVHKLVESTVVDTEGASMCNLWERVIDVLAKYLPNPSSIVRQHAAQALLTAYKRPDMNGDTSIRKRINDVIREGLHISKPSCVSAERDQHWECLEMCLIMLEDIMNFSLANDLDALMQGSDSHPANPPSIWQVIPQITNVLPSAMYHVRFEIRRMIGQLVPTFVRFVVLFSGSNGVGPYRWQYSSMDATDVIRASINAMLMSELSKALQLCMEVLDSDSLDAHASEKSETGPSFFAIDSSVIDPAHLFAHWGLHIAGRLTEIEFRKSFAVHVKRLVMLSLPAREYLFAVVQSHMEQLAAFDVLSCKTESFISCDYVELLVLQHTVVCRYRQRTDVKSLISISVPANAVLSESARCWSGIREQCGSVPTVLAFLRDPSTNPASLLVLQPFGEGEQAHHQHNTTNLSRYVCEAVAPALTNFLSSALPAADDEDVILSLAQIAGEWLICVTNKQQQQMWLDGMAFGVRSLYQAFDLLIQGYASMHSSSSISTELRTQQLGQVILEILLIAKNNEYEANFSQLLQMLKLAVQLMPNAPKDADMSSIKGLVVAWKLAIQDKLNPQMAAVDEDIPLIQADDGDEDEDANNEIESDEFSDWDEDSETNECDVTLSSVASGHVSTASAEDLVEAVSTLTLILEKLS
jgi:hypothetical protein